MTTPTPALLSFFKTFGDAGAGASSWEQAKASCDQFLARASDFAHDAMRGELSLVSKLSVADEAVAMCLGALCAAHGLTLKADEAVFKHAQALPALAAELALSMTTLEPLVRVRARAAELLVDPSPQDDDAFLAHQAAFTAASLVEWTGERTQDILSY